MLSLLLALGIMTQPASPVQLKPWQIRITQQQLEILHVDLEDQTSHKQRTLQVLSRNTEEEGEVMHRAALGAFVFLTEELRKQIPEARLRLESRYISETDKHIYIGLYSNTLQEAKISAALLAIMEMYSTTTQYFKLEYDGDDGCALDITPTGEEFFRNRINAMFPPPAPTS